MSLYIPGCPAPPPYVCDPCGENIESGKVRHLAFKKKSYTFANVNDPAEWLTAIDNQDVVLITDVFGSYDGGAVTEITGRGDSAFATSTYVHTATVSDYNYQVNYTFYEAMKNRNDYDVFLVGADWVRQAGQGVSIQIATPIDESEDVSTRGVLTIKWKSPTHPVLIPRAAINEVFVCHVDV